MDLSNRKLNLITYLAQIQDELFFDKIENFIFSKLDKEDHSDFKPFSVETMMNRIEKSENDLKKGDFKSHEDLEKESANW